MWALIKDVSTRKCRKVDAQTLITLDTHKFLYQPFRPATTKDFSVHKHYGVVDGSHVVHYYVLALGETEEKIDEILQNPRKFKLPNAPRLSIGETKELFSKYEKSLENDTAAKSSKSDKLSISEAEKDRNKEILKKHALHLKKSGDSSSKKSENPTGNGHKKKKDEPVCNKGGRFVSTKSSKDKLDAANIDKECPQSSVLDKESCDNMKDKIAEQEDAINSLQDQLKVACDENELLRQLNEALERKVVSLRKDIVKDVTEVIKTEVKGKSRDDICFVAKSMPDLPKDTQEDVPEGKVHGWSPNYNDEIDMIVYDKSVPKQIVQYHIDLCEVHVGGGHLVKVSSLRNLDINYDKYSSRVNALAHAFWGENLKRYALKPKEGDGLLKIDPQHLTSMQTFLNNMSWEKDKHGKLPILSLSNLRTAIKHCTFNAREKAVMESMTTLEKAAHIKAKKDEAEKRKAVRLALKKKQSNSDKTKKRKREDNAEEKEDGRKAKSESDTETEGEEEEDNESQTGRNAEVKKKKEEDEKEKQDFDMDEEIDEKEKQDFDMDEGIEYDNDDLNVSVEMDS